MNHINDTPSIVLRKQTVQSRPQSAKPSRTETNNNNFEDIIVPTCDNNIYSKILKIRTKLKCNQKDFAKILGITVQELSSIEKKKVILQNSMIQKLNNKLNKL